METSDSHLFTYMVVFHPLLKTNGDSFRTAVKVIVWHLPFRPHAIPSSDLAGYDGNRWYRIYSIVQLQRDLTIRATKSWIDSLRSAYGVSYDYTMSGNGSVHQRLVCRRRNGFATLNFSRYRASSRGVLNIPLDNAGNAELHHVSHRFHQAIILSFGISSVEVHTFSHALDSGWPVRLQLNI